MKIHQPIRRAIGACLIAAGALAATHASAQTLSESEQICSDEQSLERRAQSGEPIAQMLLGQLYFSGKCKPKNLATAAQWLRKALEQKAAHPEIDPAIFGYGIFVMGSLYMLGNGVQKNMVVGFALVMYATDLLKGDSAYKEASHWKAELDKILSKEQKNEAQTLLKQIQGEKNMFAPIDQYIAKSKGEN